MSSLGKILWALVICIAVAAAAVFLMGNSLPKASADAGRIDFSLLEETVLDQAGKPTYPQRLLDMAGRQVTMAGFAAPFGDPQDLSAMVITRGTFGGGCFFCAPPNLNGVMLVNRKGDELIDVGDPVKLEGRLKLKMPGDPPGPNSTFLFVLEQAHLVRPD